MPSGTRKEMSLEFSFKKSTSSSLDLPHFTQSKRREAFEDSLQPVSRLQQRIVGPSSSSTMNNSLLQLACDASSCDSSQTQSTVSSTNNADDLFVTLKDYRLKNLLKETRAVVFPGKAVVSIGQETIPWMFGGIMMIQVLDARQEVSLAYEHTDRLIQALELVCADLSPTTRLCCLSTREPDILSYPFPFETERGRNLLQDYPQIIAFVGWEIERPEFLFANRQHIILSYCQIQVTEEFCQALSQFQGRLLIDNVDDDVYQAVFDHAADLQEFGVDYRVDEEVADQVTQVGRVPTKQIVWKCDNEGLEASLPLLLEQTSCPIHLDLMWDDSALYKTLEQLDERVKALNLQCNDSLAFLPPLDHLHQVALDLEEWDHVDEILQSLRNVPVVRLWRPRVDDDDEDSDENEDNTDIEQSLIRFVRQTRIVDFRTNLVVPSRIQALVRDNEVAPRMGNVPLHLLLNVIARRPSLLYQALRQRASSDLSHL